MNQISIYSKEKSKIIKVNACTFITEMMGSKKYLVIVFWEWIEPHPSSIQFTKKKKKKKKKQKKQI